MSDPFPASPEEPVCYLYVNGLSWPCFQGEVLGRAGSVACETLSGITGLSRRHLGLEYHEGIWYVVALPESRNDTFLDGLPMERGLAYPIGSLQSLTVDGFEFFIGTTSPGGFDPSVSQDFASRDPSPVSSWDPEPHTDSVFPSWDFTRGSLQPVRESSMDDGPGSSVPMEEWISRMPGAVVLTDLQLRVLAANRSAALLLGSRLRGEELDTWMSQRIQLRAKLPGLPDPTSGWILETGYEPPGQSPRLLEWNVSRHGPQLIVAFRDLTSERMSATRLQQTPSRLAQQSRTLAALSTDPSFHEGDIARSFTLLVHQTALALSCQGVAVWLTDARPGAVRLICQACHESSGTDLIGSSLDPAFCPDFFTPLLAGQSAKLEADSPIHSILQEIGFLPPGVPRIVLCVPLHQANRLHGILAFGRSPHEPWSEEDLQFGQCLASLGILALQTHTHQETLRRLRESEAGMTAELKEANQYVQRILPEPIPEGPVTAEWELLPSEALGGDSFGYHWMGSLFVMYILDVVGHGTGMALLSVSILNNVRARLLAGDPAMSDPAGVLSQLNAAFPMENQNNMLFSMWYGVYDSRSGTLTYSSAGHPPAVLLLGEVPADAEDYATLGTEGPSIGALDGVEFTNGTIPVDSGAKLYLFTDGAFEIPASPDREWTFEEFVAVLRSTRYMTSGEPAYLRKRIASLCPLPAFPDDFTIVRFAFG